MSTSNVTVGIDIGTSSVKAIAADDDGNVVARARIPHDFYVPSPQRFEHDATVAWHAGPQRALEALGEVKPRAVSVAAMVPSLTAVDGGGIPCTPGLLYGDERGHQQERSDQPEQGELVQFLKWQAAQRPEARGYWMAQAVANNALSGDPGISMIVAAIAGPLFDWTGWDADLVSSCNARVDQLPTLHPPGQALGEVMSHPGCVLEGGTIDAFAEQLVADAGAEGDVLVILGTTLIVWAVVPEAVDIPNYYAMPNTAGGTFLVGGPSNAGGLFLNWATTLLGAGTETVDPARVPVWVPYPRGERVPLQDPTRRGQLIDLDLTHGPAAARRAALESTAFAARRMIDASPVPARRIVATGGGTRLAGWVEALADCTDLPVHVCDVPEGGALGAAFLARLACGLETSMTDASRWARTARVVEPAPGWRPHVNERYARFCEVAG
ncbi:MAG: xylulokinase [Actinomycetota bacterium]|jgi:xylulokinase|nr:xylulokinase [Actinomycetota bacterium]